MRRRIMVAAAAALALAAGTAAAPAEASTASSPTSITVNRWVSGSLRSAAETDWYAFTLPGRAYVSVVLGDLPRNYNLALYDAAGTRLARADHAGTRFEAVDRVLPAGTYRVRVGSTSGSSSTAYSLIARSVSAPRVATLTARLHEGRVVGELVNASERWALVGRATATYYAADGRRLGSFGPDYLEVWFVVPPHGKVPFNLPLLQTIVPRGTARVSVTPEVSFVADRTRPALTTSAVTRTKRFDKGIVFVRTTASVRNGSARAVRTTLLDRAYNRRGVLVLVSYLEPQVLGAGTSRRLTSQVGGYAPATMAKLTLTAKPYEATNFLPFP